jgi:hypothetical protein
MDIPSDRKNAFAGTILDDMYVGNISKYVVKLEAFDSVVTCEARNAADSNRFTRNQKVHISWQLDDTILLQQ